MVYTQTLGAWREKSATVYIRSLSVCMYMYCILIKVSVQPAEVKCQVSNGEPAPCVCTHASLFSGNY